MSRLTVVTFKWQPKDGPAKFTSRHVNVLARMVKRNYLKPHRFVCITDEPHGLDPSIEVLPLWEDHSGMRNPHGPDYPSCYRRLKLFSPEMRDVLGERFVCLDLDTVITADLSPLWDRTEDFVILKGTNPSTYYNGGMVLMTAGARADVWDHFDPKLSPALALSKRQFGSDQGWISYKLGPDEATWGRDDGVYSWVPHLKSGQFPLPEGARMVFFNGKHQNPWDTFPQSFAWVRENWR